MSAQPLTDAFKPTIKPPDTAAPGEVGLGGVDGAVGRGEAGGAGVGCVVDPGAGAGVGCADPDRGGCAWGWLVDFSGLGGAWRPAECTFALRRVRTH